MKTKTLILLGLVLFAAIFLRVWQTGRVPLGLYSDELSSGYNALSILKTGKDRYGMVLPFIFKSFGSYQPPVYAYFTIIPTIIFGPGILAVKFVSIISGILTVIFTFLIIRDFVPNEENRLSILTAGVLAIAPWAVFFSRIATEASPALALFIAGFYFSLKSVNSPKVFPLAALFLGLATHAYYSERIISLFFIIGFLILNKRQLFKNKKMLLLGLAVFALTQVPNLVIFKTGAFTKRLTQVSYVGVNTPIGVVREFSSQYSAYFSPRNLFFEPDDQGARAMPELSVFYKWMVIPYFLGFVYLIKRKNDYFVKNLIFLMLIAPIPAALARDPFYTLRVLVLMWVFTVIISIGIWMFLKRLKHRLLFCTIIVLFVIVSLSTLYAQYFVLDKIESSDVGGYYNFELMDITQKNKNDKFVIDLSRDVSVGLRFAYFSGYDPALYQKEMGSQFLNTYYTSDDYEKYYKFENVEIRPIHWEEDVYKDQFIVGDLLAVSEQQALEHKLSLKFEVKDAAGKVVLRGYRTNPKEKCLSQTVMNIYCKKV
jgi:4-amino-4-deoxy-L-arabinose transferase-like glycosyltransferase